VKADRQADPATAFDAHPVSDAVKPAATVADLAGARGIIVCCGSGGVGKTTVSAAIGLEGARRGRRVCVLTVDPARRLADALGIQALDDTPHVVTGPWAGDLRAVMLDAKGTFDDLVHRYAPSPEQAQAITSNRIYRNLTGGLSGTQEYMAMEKLYELAEGGDFDLVVVDTPPTRHALDFLEAPERLTRFLEHRLFRMLLVPTRAYLRAVSVATQALLRTISRVAGAEIVEDAIAFFRAFDGMEEGFRERARRVRALLEGRSTGFVLVSSPRPDTVTEAGWFADKLEELDLHVEGLVVNRVHPDFPVAPDADDAPAGSDLAALAVNLERYRGVARREELAFAELALRLSSAPVARVPLLDGDVHDVAGLSQVADHLGGVAVGEP
jgi:anion-transporting  ArsA/GET3 family ATPase